MIPVAGGLAVALVRQQSTPLTVPVAKSPARTEAMAAGANTVGPVVGRPSILARYLIAPRMSALVVSSFNERQLNHVWALAKEECQDRSALCSVGMWTDDVSTPRRLKMTDSLGIGKGLSVYVESSYKDGV
jgi:hypothetical protein